MMRLIIGPNAVVETLLHHPERIQKILLLPKLKRSDEIVELADINRIKHKTAGRNELSQIAGTSSHQGVVAEVKAGPQPEIEDIVPGDGTAALILVLDQVQDPQNLGSLMRTASAFGAHGIIIPRRHAAKMTPAVSKASAGASEIIPVCTVSNLARALDRLRKMNVWIIGLDSSAEASLENAPWSESCALVLGSEGSGLRRLTRDKCDQLVRIDMKGPLDSLGVSAAGAIALYAAAASRREK